jgi:hypothetical protein
MFPLPAGLDPVVRNCSRRQRESILLSGFVPAHSVGSSCYWFWFPLLAGDKVVIGVGVSCLIWMVFYNGKIISSTEAVKLKLDKRHQYKRRREGYTCINPEIKIVILGLIFVKVSCNFFPSAFMSEIEMSAAQ